MFITRFIFNTIWIMIIATIVFYFLIKCLFPDIVEKELHKTKMEIEESIYSNIKKTADYIKEFKSKMLKGNKI